MIKFDPPRRVLVGGLCGLVVFSVDVVATIVRFALVPSLAERTTTGSLLAMIPFAFLFVAAGALLGYLWTLQIRSLRFMLMGAIAGALVWGYWTATWPLTAKPTSVVPPQGSVLGAVAIGAGGGALGGLLRFAISGIRRWAHDRR